jgi:O-acetyl-ADP-ribose deacetylase (regulator of RNase III)
MDELSVGRARLRLVRGDITEADTAAIVNAANHTLLGGGGVDGAIHRKGGPAILEECQRLRSGAWPDGLPTGEAVATTGGALRARQVIHTVGPVWQGGGRKESALLASCYRRALRVAREEGLESVAFPSISTGAYGYPVAAAARVALSAVLDELRAQPDAFDEVRFVLFTAGDLAAYADALAGLAGAAPGP